MNDHTNDSYADYAEPLKRLFGGNLEPVKRPFADVCAAADHSVGYTTQQKRRWFRGATTELVTAGLVKRIRPGGQNTSVTHLLLLAEGQRVLSDALSRDQQVVAAPDSGDSPAADLPPHDELTFHDHIRALERFCERYNYQFEWTMTNRREGVSRGDVHTAS